MSNFQVGTAGRQDANLNANHTRWAHNKAFIQQTAAPELFTTMPPSTNHPSAVYKKVTIDNTFTIPMLAPGAPKQVEPGTGLILWFPQQGVDSIIHMGIIPQNTSMVRESGTPGFNDNDVTLTVNSLSNSGQTTGSAGDLYTGVSALVFTKAVCVPRLDAIIKITPKLEESFSLTRGYGGEISIWSDTIAAGTMSLTGTSAAAVISDTRDISQNKDGTDSFAWGSLNQAARTWKECTNEVTIGDGVTTIQGSDIAPDFAAPNATNDVRVSGGWDQPYQFPPITKTCNFNDAPAANNSGRVQIPIMTAWYSPWGVNQSEGFGSNNSQGTGAYAFSAGILPNDAIVLPALAETSTLQVKFDCDLYASNPNFAGGIDVNDFGVAFDVVIEHYFAGVLNSYNQNASSFPIVGTPNVRILRTVHSKGGKVNDFLRPTGSYSSQLDANPPFSLSCISNIDDQYIGEGGTAVFGKFIGCKVYVCARALSANGSNAIVDVNLYSFSGSVKNTVVNDNPSQFVDVITGPQISFFAPEINDPGACGPCHVIRYSDVGAGQQVRINGMLNTESVAKGSLAPYVQDQVMNAKIASDVNVLPLIWMLYNGTSEFKMSWERPIYKAWINTQIRHMSAESLNDLADGDSRVQTAMEAAGLFSGIIGGLGHMVGGTIDSIVGSAGQYGGTSARGQFGATGQFGETHAGSSFGALRRNRTC